jgi:hypothetical protein
MKKLLNAASLLPIALGAAIGGTLAAFGAYEDAPGMSAIGLMAGYALILAGLRNGGAIRKGWLAPILLFSYSAFIALLTTAILLDGEFGRLPQLSAIGYLAAAGMLAFGAHIAFQRKKGVN